MESEFCEICGKRKRGNGKRANGTQKYRYMCEHSYNEAMEYINNKGVTLSVNESKEVKKVVSAPIKHIVEADIIKPKKESSPTLPFTQEEIEKLKELISNNTLTTPVNYDISNMPYESKKGRIGKSINWNPDLWNMLQHDADKYNKSVADIVNFIVRRYYG